jgi:serine/threonine protein phosphatase 1
MSIIIGDVHGCYKTLMELLKKLPDENIFFVGDLVDRGPSSKEVVQFLIDHPEMRCVMGNHEQVMVDAVKSFSSYKLWVNNPRIGGYVTAQSYCEDKLNFKLFSSKLLEEFSEHYEYLSKLPMFIEEEDLFISHSYYDSATSWEDIEAGEDSLLWNRYEWPSDVIRNNKKMFHVFGHSPQEGEAHITKSFANIDTGACYKKIGMGFLTAIQYPSMKIFTQENLD